ncbi:hypothetical protein FOL47_001630 [Perkinsus chesapeaki]|uniref:Uncharacterized protein n=1 Tax=Perkinsus chesapeaki TaxID=330153 RepID=A0A7J6N0J5_PERCH|nr:hypothetical protein FOL47_001630 [Perkinsus chesapeaki]
MAPNSSHRARYAARQQQQAQYTNLNSAGGMVPSGPAVPDDASRGRCFGLRLAMGTLPIGFSEAMAILLLTSSLVDAGVSSWLIGYGWLVSPLAAILVQPCAAVWSDRSTWSRFGGRRKPFLLMGYVFALIACAVLSLASELPGNSIVYLAIGFGLLFISNNMQLLMLRSLVTDTVPRQSMGVYFSLQTLFYVFGASLTYALGYLVDYEGAWWIEKLKSDSCGSMTCLHLRGLAVLCGCLQFIMAHSVLMLPEVVTAVPPEQRGRCCLCFKWIADFFCDIKDLLVNATSTGLVFLAAVGGFIGVSALMIYGVTFLTTDGLPSVMPLQERYAMATYGLYGSMILGVVTAMCLPFVERFGLDISLCWVVSLLLFASLLISSLALPRVADNKAFGLSWMILGLGPMYATQLTIPLTLLARTGTASAALRMSMLSVAQAVAQILVSVTGGLWAGIFHQGAAVFAVSAVCAALAALLALAVYGATKSGRAEYYDGLEDEESAAASGGLVEMADASVVPPRIIGKV